MNYELLFLIALIGSPILFYLAFSFGQSYYRWKSIHMLGELMNDGLFRLLGGEAPNNGNTTNHNHKKPKKSSSGFGFTNALFLVAGTYFIIMWGLQDYTPSPQANKEEQKLEQEDNGFQASGEDDSHIGNNPKVIFFEKDKDQPKEEVSKPKNLNRSPSSGEGQHVQTYDQQQNLSVSDPKIVSFKHVLQFGAFSSESGARKHASELFERCKNKQLYLYDDSVSGYTKVLVGGFTSNAEAKAFGKLFDENSYPVRADNIQWEKCLVFNIDST